MELVAAPVIIDFHFRKDNLKDCPVSVNSARMDDALGRDVASDPGPSIQAQRAKLVDLLTQEAGKHTRAFYSMPRYHDPASPGHAAWLSVDKLREIDLAFVAWPRRYPTPSGVQFLSAMDDEELPQISFIWSSACGAFGHDRVVSFYVDFGDSADDEVDVLVVDEEAAVWSDDEDDDEQSGAPPTALRLVGVELNPGPAAASTSATTKRSPPSTKRPQAKRQRRIQTFMVSERLGVSREFIETRFRLSPSATDDEVQRCASMLRHTMMDYGDVYEYSELREYERLFRPQWPALYKRWLANKSHSAGEEWAVFDNVGRIEFVRQGGSIVTASMPFPNEFALGPEGPTTVPAASYCFPLRLFGHWTLTGQRGYA